MDEQTKAELEWYKAELRWLLYMLSMLDYNGEIEDVLLHESDYDGHVQDWARFQALMRFVSFCGSIRQRWITTDCHCSQGRWNHEPAVTT